MENLISLLSDGNNKQTRPDSFIVDLHLGRADTKQCETMYSDMNKTEEDKQEHAEQFNLWDVQREDSYKADSANKSTAEQSIQRISVLKDVADDDDDSETDNQSPSQTGLMTQPQIVITSKKRLVEENNELKKLTYQSHADALANHATKKPNECHKPDDVEMKEAISLAFKLMTGSEAYLKSYHRFKDRYVTWNFKLLLLNRHTPEGVKRILL